MWPWLMILAGTLLIIGALVARHRMMRDYRAQLQSDRVASRTTKAQVASSPPPALDGPAPDAPAIAATGPMPVVSVMAASPSAASAPAALPGPTPEAPAASAPAVPTPAGSTPTGSTPAAPGPPPPAVPVPAFARAAQTPIATTRREVKAARAAGQPVVTGPPPLFADLPVGHRLTTAPTVRAGAQDVPLQDWLRYYAEGNAWSGVIQSISDRVTGDPLLQPYFGGMDRTTLQRHVTSTVMMLTGEGVTVGAVRRLADAHLRHVQSGGHPVTEAVWNRMAATLGNALREHAAPEAAILSLNATVSPLRSVIVSRDGA
ncbi:hypothetical protein Q9R29_01290 [Rothia sp. ARF10]|nr:hypothetical protein [Rothia sp. ARF10]